MTPVLPVSAAQTSVSGQPAARGSLCEAALTLAILPALAATIGTLWWRKAPRAGEGLERYLRTVSSHSTRRSQ